MSGVTISSISCQDLHELSQHQPVTVIDVRTPEEFRELRTTLARNVPLDVLEPARVIAAREGNKEEPIYLICHLGGRSAHACQMFLAAGFSNVVNVTGGTDAWLSAGLPVERGTNG